MSVMKALRNQRNNTIREVSFQDLLNVWQWMITFKDPNPDSSLNVMKQEFSKILIEKRRLNRINELTEMGDEITKFEPKKRN